MKRSGDDFHPDWLAFRHALPRVVRERRNSVQIRSERIVHVRRAHAISTECSRDPVASRFESSVKSRSCKVYGGSIGIAGRKDYPMLEYQFVEVLFGWPKSVGSAHRSS